MLLGWRMTAGMAFRNHVARRFHISARRIIAGAQKHGRKWEGKKSERGEIGKKSNRETWTSCHNFRSNQRFSKSSRKIKLSFLCKVCNDSYQIRERERAPKLKFWNRLDWEGERRRRETLIYLPLLVDLRPMGAHWTIPWHHRVTARQSFYCPWQSGMSYQARA